MYECNLANLTNWSLLGGDEGCHYKAPFTLEINFEIYVNLFLSKQKISSVNSQLSKEINFEMVFRNLEHVLFWEISPMECFDWSVGQSLQTSNEASTASSIGVVDDGFQKFISSVKSAHFQKKNFEMFLL